MTEHSEQAAFVEEVLYRYRNDPTFVRGLFFSTFNGAWLGGNPGARARQMQKAKEAGFLPGVSDLLYLQARGKFHYLAIEMKDKSSGKVSPAQEEFIQAVTNAGGYADICFGADQAIADFESYMLLEATA
jgi:hypothetical protein